jgi:hypothetical protein
MFEKAFIIYIYIDNTPPPTPGEIGGWVWGGTHLHPSYVGTIQSAGGWWLYGRLVALQQQQKTVEPTRVEVIFIPTVYTRVKKTSF